MSDTQTIYVIGGPTASGKSAFALDLAAKHNGVIINADSMQIYDGLPTLTAQPPCEDMDKAEHALYGVLHPNTPCSAGNWREMVEPLITQLLRKGKTPIICGGSGLYIKALIEGLSPIPDIPEDVRERVVRLQKELGNPTFHLELQKRDPVMANRFHPFHTARLVRAMEVLEATGKSLAEWQEIPPLLPPENWRFDITLIMPEREILYDRCNRRFLQMMENGVMDEVETYHKLLTNGEVEDNKPLNKALGFKPLRRYLLGEISKEHAIELSQNETRRYAKRQVTWFRHQIREAENILGIRTLQT